MNRSARDLTDSRRTFSLSFGERAEMRDRLFSIGAAICLALFLTGCSSFQKEWKTALKQPQSGINGAWQGEWRSEKNGHHGSLKCVVTQSSPTTFRAHFRAKYMKILQFTYAATLTGQETNGAVRLEGSANLGKLAGGIYTYEGTVTPTEFRSTYKSKYDHGHYEMTRPK
jgi:hypothetical protein